MNLRIKTAIVLLIRRVVEVEVESAAALVEGAMHEEVSRKPVLFNRVVAESVPSANAPRRPRPNPRNPLLRRPTSTAHGTALGPAAPHARVPQLKVHSPERKKPGDWPWM